MSDRKFSVELPWEWMSEIEQEADFFARHDRAKDEAKVVGLAAAQKHIVDTPNLIRLKTPAVFGEKWRRGFFYTRWMLRKDYGRKFQDLCGLAVREYVYACHAGAAYCKGIEVPGYPKTGAYARLNDPNTYADVDGWATTLNESLANLESTPLYRHAGFSERPSAEHILWAMSIVWFFEAGSTYPDDSRKALDLLFEAANARSYAHDLFMWNESEKCVHESLQLEKSVRAKEMNNARHSAKYKAEEMVLREWKKNPRQFDSGAKAGLHFSGWLASRGIEYSPRTVTEWILGHAKVAGIRFR